MANENEIQHEAPPKVVTAIKARLKRIGVDINTVDIWRMTPCICKLCNDSQAKTSYTVDDPTNHTDTGMVEDPTTGFFCTKHGLIAFSRKGRVYTERNNVIVQIPATPNHKPPLSFLDN